MSARPSVAVDHRHDILGALGAGRRLVVVLVLAAAIFSTACSSDRRLDRAGLEADIRGQLFPDHPELVTAVNCPDLRDPTPGRSFVCAAQLGDEIIDVPVELGGTAEALEALVELDERFVAAREIADLLAETFSREIAIPTTVDCGQAIVVLDPGAPVVCTATDPSGAVRTFDVSIDEAGALELSIR